MTCTLGTSSRSILMTFVQNCPVSGCGLAMGVQSLPVLVFAGDLAVIAAITDGHIDYQNLSIYSPL